jgi:hypothetical protein
MMPLQDRQGNNIRGGFCRRHGVFNATYQVWAPEYDYNEDMAKGISQSNAAWDRVIERQKYNESGRHRCVICNMACAHSSLQAGLCKGCFQTQMACKTQGIRGYFK